MCHGTAFLHTFQADKNTKEVRLDSQYKLLIEYTLWDFVRSQNTTVCSRRKAKNTYRVGFLADTFTAPKVIDMVGYWVWRCKIVGIWLYVHATVSPIIIASVMI